MTDANIERFRAITSSTVEEARHMLEAAGGRVDAAVELYFTHSSSTKRKKPVTNGRGGVSRIEKQGKSSSSSADEDGVRAPMQRQTGVLIPHTFAQSYGARRAAPAADSVFDNFRDFQAEAEAQFHSQRTIAQRTAAHTPDSATTSAGSSTTSDDQLHRLKNLFRPPVDLITTGDFETVKSVAVANNKWLIVNIQDVSEFACQVLNRDVWNNSIVRDIINTNFVFWQVHADSADGARMRVYYHVRTLPYVAVLDPRVGELVCTVPANDAGVVAETRVLHARTNSHATVTTFLSDYPTYDFIDARHKRAQPQSNGRAHKRASSEALVDEVPPKRHSAAAAPHFAAIAEPVVMDNWQSLLGKSDDILTIMFRFADGTRQSQVFPVDTPVEVRVCARTIANLQALYAYVRSIAHAPSSPELVLNYPRRTLDTLAIGTLLSTLDWHKQEVIHVHARLAK